MCRSYSILSSHAWYDMKKTVKKLMCFALSFFMFSLCGCGGEEKISEVNPEKTGYIAAEPDTSREEKIKEVLQSYLTALEHHSISELAACSSDELPLYNDQTAFDDITDELESARLDKIYLDGIRLKGDKVQAAAEYTLIYSGSHITEDGSISPPGKYRRRELFTFVVSGDDYRITSIEPTAAD